MRDEVGYVELGLGRENRYDVGYLGGSEKYNWDEESVCYD